MTITFFSNFMNIHQLPFCEELMKHIGAENFKFVATRQMDPDRVQMGFEDMNVTKPFVVRAYEGGEAAETAKRLAVESDVAIIGSAPSEYLLERMKHNKLTFKYNERILKRGDWMWFHPVLHRFIRRTFTKNKNKNLYVLCASAYTKRDLSLFGFPKDKCFKWGYFPEMEPYPNYGYLLEKKLGLKRPGVSILWAGRLIGLKHPEVALSVAKHLKERGTEFEMNIIGDGPLRPELDKKVSALGLSDKVHLLGAQSHDFVLDEMEKADIFLFTSDRNEGWGAVLNEAMNAGCAVVADKNIGSVPFLIRDGVNGHTYNARESNRRDKIIDRLVSDKAYRNVLGHAAWDTMNLQWTIQNAVEKLIQLINNKSTGHSIVPIDGPCSMA